MYVLGDSLECFGSELRRMNESLSALDCRIPLYNCYGEQAGMIRLGEAIALNGQDLELRARGSGRRRYFTSAKLYARTSVHWKKKSSAGYMVMQLVSA
jgi:hypothetical protein